MDQRKESVSRATIASKNSRAKYQINGIIKRAELLQTDPDKKVRLENNLCLCCHYVNNPRMSGAAFTRRPCGLCETDMTFSSTATDVLCSSCASEQNLCKQCGADIDLKSRKKRYPFEQEI